MNKVILIGNVGKDPEIINFENGNKLAKFTLATTEFYKDKSGEKASETTWHNLTVFGPVASVVEKYIKKGAKIAIEGKIQIREYETKEGEKRRSFEIVVKELMMLDSKKTEPKATDFVKEGEDDLPF